MSLPTYVLGSGWWCSESQSPIDGERKFLGDNVIRSKDFHRLWYQSVDRFTKPEKIFIVDSCSPVKPLLDENDSRLEFVSFTTNAGQST